MRGASIFDIIPSQRVAKLKKNVENRCPVMNLMRDADVAVTAEWNTVSK